MEIEVYRQAILDAVLAATNEKGEPIAMEKAAREALETLSDQELIDGMPFNSPEDVAQVILESL